jgi:hypothetical protein
MRAHPIALTAVSLLACAAACTVQQAPSSAPSPASNAPAARSPAVTAASAASAADFSDQINRFAEDLASFKRFYTIGWSEGAIDRQEAFLQARLDALSRLDFAPLSQTARVDAVLLRNEIRDEIARLRLSRRQLAEGGMSDVLSIRSIIVPLEEARWRMDPPPSPRVDPKAAAVQLARIPAAVKAVRERIEKYQKLPADKKEKLKAEPSAALKGSPSDADTPLAITPVTAQRAAGALLSYSATLHTWFDAYSGYEPAFDWWCGKPYGEAAKSIDEFAKYLREEVAGIKGNPPRPTDPLVGDPIGREALLENLRNEVIAYSPEELIEIGEREMAWCTEQAKAAAREMGFTKDGGDWRAALEKIKGEVSAPGEQAAFVIGVAREAIAYVKDHDFVTIPPMCEELWKAQMLSPETQRTLPFAVYFSQAIGIAAPTESMSNEDKLMAMRGNNRRFTRIVVPHELIPGHHLQGFMAAREKPYRRRFSTPFLVEGWALYWEMKLWDLSENRPPLQNTTPWAKGPEDRLGMLFWRMHRCARITVSLKFHLGQMSPQEMIDYLCDNVGHERANATAEVRRYISGDYGPLYQCGYMTGGKQLRALHDELVPSSMTEKQFNDAVLHCGPIPVELIRAELENAPLRIDSEASWKFAK